MPATVARRILGALRSDEWLQSLYEDIWRSHFRDVPRVNDISIEFARHWKTRLGMIRMTEDECTSYIGINGLLRHPDAPEVIAVVTIAHELCHYTHGFGSPHPRRFTHPHAGNVVGIELEARGLSTELTIYEEWLSDCWHDFYDQHVSGLKGPRRAATPLVTLPAVAADARR